MLMLAQNSVIRIDAEGLQGLFRVVAEDPRYPETYLTRLREAGADASPKRWNLSLLAVDREYLHSLFETKRLETVNLLPEPKHIVPPERLTSSERKLREGRTQTMMRFLDPKQLAVSIYVSKGVGPLVAQTVKEAGCSRSSVYRLCALLFQFGFDAGSLNPRYYRSGAPGVRRPVGPERHKAGRKTNAERLGTPVDVVQPGCSEDWLAKVLAADAKIASPKPKSMDRYQLIIRDFSPGYRQTESGVERIPPEKGAYPNKRQVRHILEQYSKIKRLRESTTLGHFNRNVRGLHGRSWEGVAGPGHTYAIDSTIGDVYLRSQVNRAWIIGRPIVYFIVDVWSTAIVGFHVCLAGPSWETARLAIFSTAASLERMVGLWGLEEMLPTLDPFPGLPYVILGDRGEYLSLGGRLTAISLGVNLDYAPPYRPDLKGMVEVLHRIAKDQQYFFVPGAMDARRKEWELRKTKNGSAYTLPEYVQYLVWRIALYNLYADRRHRMDPAMISAGVYPSPAGLWRFGFQMGIGYRKQIPEPKLITNLFPEHTGTIRRDGIFLGKLEYHSELAQTEQWTTLARQFGRMTLPLYYFPGAMRKVWTPHPHEAGLLELNLSDQAVAPGHYSMDECLEAWINQTLCNASREHETVLANFLALQKIETQAKRAETLTREAEDRHRGAKPTITEARQMELQTFFVEDHSPKVLGCADLASAEASLKEQGDQRKEKNNLLYAGLMDQILGAFDQ